MVAECVVTTCRTFIVAGYSFLKEILFRLNMQIKLHKHESYKSIVVSSIFVFPVSGV